VGPPESDSPGGARTGHLGADARRPGLAGQADPPPRLRCNKRLPLEIDREHGPNCGGELKILAAILEAPVIEKVLTHEDLQAHAAARAPARDQALKAARACPTVAVQATQHRAAAAS